MTQRPIQRRPRWRRSVEPAPAAPPRPPCVPAAKWRRLSLRSRRLLQHVAPAPPRPTRAVPREVLGGALTLSRTVGIRTAALLYGIDENTLRREVQR